MKFISTLFLILTLTTCISSCATTDCSVYKATSPQRCKCIRENGDVERARKCSIIASKKYKERMKKLCYRTCFSAYDCSKCEEL